MGVTVMESLSELQVPPSSPSSISSTSPLQLSPSDVNECMKVNARYRTMARVDYSERKRRTTTRKRALPEALSECEEMTMKKKVCVRCPGWIVEGRPLKKRVYTNNDASGVARVCLESVVREKDGMRLKAGDDVDVWTRDENNTLTCGKARITQIFVPLHSTLPKAAILWYYSPDQIVSRGDAEPTLPNELYASRHMDEVGLGSIEGHITVMNGHSYNRMMGDKARSMAAYFPPTLIKKKGRTNKKKADYTVYFCRYEYKYREGVVSTSVMRKSNDTASEGGKKRSKRRNR